MIDDKEIKIDILGSKGKGMHPVYDGRNFVRVEHLPTGITVTKWSTSQWTSKQKCLVEIKELLRMWRS